MAPAVARPSRMAAFMLLTVRVRSAVLATNIPGAGRSASAGKGSIGPGVWSGWAQAERSIRAAMMSSSLRSGKTAWSPPRKEARISESAAAGASEATAYLGR